MPRRKRQNRHPASLGDTPGEPSHSVRVTEQLRRQNEVLSALHETARGLMGGLRFEPLLKAIVARASDLAGTPHAHVYLVNQEADVLEVRVAIGVSRRLLGQRRKRGESIAGRVWETGELLAVNEYDTWPGRSPQVSSGVYRAAIGIPLKSGDDVVGVMILAHTEPGKTFGPDTVNLLNRFAELSSLALHTARLHEQLAYQAHHDALTGLPNRVLNEDRLQQALARARRHGSLVALLLVDLDHFKQVNDAFGHRVGDAVLTEAARRMSVCLRSTDTVARWGGDEFTVVLPDLESPGDAAQVAEKILRGLREPCVVEDRSIFVSASIGISLFPTDGHTPDELLLHADSAMYRAEQLGRDAYAFFSPEGDTRVMSRLASEAEVRAARQVGRAQLYQDLQTQVERFRVFAEVGRRLRAAQTLDEMYSILGKETMALFGAAYTALVLVDPEHTTFTRVWSEGIGAGGTGATFPVEGSRSGAVLRTGTAYVTDDIIKDPLAPWMDAARYERLGPWTVVPVRSEERIIGVLSLRRARDSGRPFTDEEVHLLESFVEIGGTAIRRAQLHQDLRSQIETLKSLYEASAKFAESLDLHHLAADAARACVETFGVQAAWLGRVEPGGAMRLFASYPPTIEFIRQIVIDLSDSSVAHVATARALRTGSPAVTHDVTQSPHRPPWYEQVLAEGLRSIAGFPLVSRTRTFGVLALYSNQVGFFTPQRIEFFQAYAHQLAAALENARLYADAGRRLEQLQGLRSIDTAISSKLDLRRTLDILLEHAVTQLGVDAADVLSFDARSRALNFSAGRGFRTAALQHTCLSLGEGYAGRAALDRSLVAVSDLAAAPEGFARAPLLAREEFVTYYAVPLVAKEQVNGVLEVFHRRPLAPDQEWLDFLKAIAGQAAIAIENATVLVDLQRANSELALAYDRTIEGWSRALDLRDMKTEGHTQRVTDLTLRLAREMGVPEAELVHLRRGALLHDIGKMGVPDTVLLKPGPLTDEEWAIMRRHPVYACELLSPIAYLRSALDIPCHHHEKWDGTGYPRGLKGEQIPLAARIFAVIDVWDALCSDRPYRPAWTKKQAMEYIRAQSGVHFDPAVVEAFMRMELCIESRGLAP